MKMKILLLVLSRYNVCHFLHGRDKPYQKIIISTFYTINNEFSIKKKKTHFDRLILSKENIMPNVICSDDSIPQKGEIT